MAIKPGQYLRNITIIPFELHDSLPYHTECMYICTYIQRQALVLINRQKVADTFLDQQCQYDIFSLCIFCVKKLELLDVKI